MDQTFFYSSIRPGRTHEDAKIDISHLQDATDGVSYKLEHTDKYWTLSSQRLRDVYIRLELNKLQNNPLSITMRKWKYLQSLKIKLLLSTHSLDPCGGNPIIPLLVHQPAHPSIWSATPSLQQGVSTNPGVTMWCVCGCS